MRFCFSMESEFPQISTKAMKVLIPFTSTYLQIQIKAAGGGRLAFISLCTAAPHRTTLRLKSEASVFPLIWTIKLKVKVVLS